MKFYCQSCHVERSFATELSKFSRRSMADPNRTEDAFMVCIYCAPNDHIPNIIPERQSKVEVRYVPPSPVVTDNVLSYADVAKRLGIKPSTVRRYVTAGYFPSMKVGDRTYVKVSDVEAYEQKKAAGELDWSRTNSGERQKPKRTGTGNSRETVSKQKRKDLAALVLDKRRELNISQREMGELVGKEQGCISRIERQVPVLKATAKQVMEALDVPQAQIDNILGGRSNHAKSPSKPVFRAPRKKEPETPTVIVPPVSSNGAKTPEAAKTLLEASKAMLEAGNTTGAQMLMEMALEQMNVGQGA